MAKPDTYAMPVAPTLRRVPPSAIPLVPSWRERVLRAWDSVSALLRQPGLARPKPNAAGRGQATSANVVWTDDVAAALGELDAHTLADIGAPEELRMRAVRDRELRHQRLIEIEQGHRAYQDARW